MTDKKYSLFIDSSTKNETVVELRLGEETVATVRNDQKSGQLVNAIEGICRHAGISVEEIRDVRVHTGPGSFTGLRSGITIARILGLLLEVPVNGNDPVQFIEPSYEKSKFDF